MIRTKQTMKAGKNPLGSTAALVMGCILACSGCTTGSDDGAGVAGAAGSAGETGGTAASTGGAAGTAASTGGAGGGGGAGTGGGSNGGGGEGGSGGQGGATGQQGEFVLLWASPTRAYPEIPLDFRFVVYEEDNQPLTWTLSNAPAGMTIDADGLLNWTPPSDGTGSYTITLRVTRSQGDSIERTFTVTVGTSDFLFVSTSGSDEATGTLAAPFRTLEHALQAVANGDGKTVYLREGVYSEAFDWESFGHPSPLRGKAFSAIDPVEVRSYPGESAILDGGSTKRGVVFYETSYLIVDNLEARNFSTTGVVVTGSQHVVVRDTVVHDVHGAASDNCTGYLLEGVTDTVVDSASGYDNFDPDNIDPGSPNWNSSNFLVYNDSSTGTNYILHSSSSGSVVGFKIKHAGPAKLVLHGDLSESDIYGYVVGSDGSSVRYCLSSGSSTGILAGGTDPNKYMHQAVVIEKNTIVNATSTGISFQSGYFTQASSSIHDNIIFNDLEAAGTNEDDDRLMGLWFYDAEAGTYPLDSDWNLFYSPSSDNIIRRGNSAAGTFNYSFEAWVAASYDTHSIFANPLFSNGSSGDFRPAAGSSACGAASDGGDIGALPCL
jgi:hypothetical protein